MTIKKIFDSEAEYQTAIARIDEIFDAPKGSQKGRELELLVLLVNKYEDEHYPIAAADPIDAIKYRMEELGWTNRNLEELLGDKATVSRILNRKRDLSVVMMRKICKHLGIPADILLQAELC
ncbi:MAG: helix-turn-helix domain-containing protein [Bacteroidota bacterium]